MAQAACVGSESLQTLPIASPKRLMLALASSSGCPFKLGTTTKGRSVSAMLTIRSTARPASRKVPDWGLWLTTYSCNTVGSKTGAPTNSKSSFDNQFFSLIYMVRHIGTCASGPLLTTTQIVRPSFTRRLAAGSANYPPRWNLCISTSLSTMFQAPLLQSNCASSTVNPLMSGTVTSAGKISWGRYEIARRGPQKAGQIGI